MTPEPLTKAARLAIGGAVAPVVRRQAAAPRKVTVIDKDGKPVRETTHVEVAKAVLARSEIEFSVQEGKRPAYVACSQCGHPVKVPKTGAMPTKCRAEAPTPCNRLESDDERARDHERIRAFAAARGLSDEWAARLFQAKYGSAALGKVVRHG